MGTEKCSNKRNRSKKREEAVTDDEAKYLEWRSNEAYRAVSRRSLEVTFSLLSKKQKLTSTEQKRRQSCRGISPHSVSLDTASVIFKGIRTSILTKNWNALNELLLQLLSKHKIYRNYVRKLCKLNFQLNSADPARTVYKEYLQLTRTSHDLENRINNESIAKQIE